MGDEYRRFRLTSSTAEERERLLAEAFDAGAAGAEEDERLAAGDILHGACVYAARDAAKGVWRAVKDRASASTRIGAIESVPEVDWSEAWKEGLEALRISERLVVRPPFVAWELEPGQREVVIDPGQAFGTGGHASTRVCLEAIDALYADPSAGRRLDRVLDVGCGSGVLALAAVALGARQALGFDLDPVAVEAACEAARRNGLADRVRFETGPIGSVVPEEEPWPLVVANLLKREILPIASEVAQCVAPGGCLLLSGLLEADGPEVRRRFEAEGLEERLPLRLIVDDPERWIGLCLGRRPNDPW